MTVIDVLDVTKRYRRAAIGERRLHSIGEWGPSVERWALRDVSFQVSEGETFGIVGRNGSGKSTILRLIAGVTRPTSGWVSVYRRVSALLTLGEGFHPLLTAEENAVTQAILAGLTRRQAQARLQDIAAFAELEEHMDQSLRTFSDGMRLRLGFAVAINVDPEVLLIDELLAVGDLRFQRKCLDHLETLQASGVTIVVASHDLSQVRKMCVRALWLNDGRVSEIGKASEVVERYENAMNSAAPRRESPSAGGHRLGSGEVDITQIRLLNARGRETSSIVSGEAVTIEIRFAAHQAVPDAIFGVSARSKHDTAAVFDLSTAKDGHSVGRLGGEGAISLHVDRFDLEAGAYWLDVGIYEANWDRPYDYLWQALPFDVSAADSGAEAPFTHRWSMK
jgi:homopolymeric O-antigen transport system ATP-binding protein